MSPTIRLISFLHRVAINRRTQEPRRGVSGFVYYGAGAFAAFIVVSMVLIGLEAYDLNFIRDLLYRLLGKPFLSMLESLLF